MQITRMWQQWTNVVLGLWIAVIPFLGLAGATLMWTLVVSGIAVAVLALWSTAREQSPEYRTDERVRLQHR